MKKNKKIKTDFELELELSSIQSQLQYRKEKKEKKDKLINFLKSSIQSEDLEIYYEDNPDKDERLLVRFKNTPERRVHHNGSNLRFDLHINLNGIEFFYEPELTKVTV